MTLTLKRRSLGLFTTYFDMNVIWFSFYLIFNTWEIMTEKAFQNVSFVVYTWVLTVLYPGKGDCADPVNEDAILEREGGGESQDQSGERQLASDTGGGKTWTTVKWKGDERTRKTTPSRLKNTSMHRVS